MPKPVLGVVMQNDNQNGEYGTRLWGALIGLAMNLMHLASL